LKRDVANPKEHGNLERKGPLFYSIELKHRTGRICFKGRKVNLSHVFAGQNAGVTQVGERVWRVTFMRYDLGYLDDETCRLEPIENPFGPKLLPLRSE
jgi:putative transposase